MIYVSFKLSMPSNNSWNGRWSGEERLYVRTKQFHDRGPLTDKVKGLVGSHSYNFGDGLVACVTVEIVTPAERKNLDKRSSGFCGYDWMIDSLLLNGKIMVREAVK